MALKREIIGLDIGQSCIKIVHVQPGRGLPVVRNVVTAETGYDPSNPSDDVRQRTINLLQSIWREYKFRSKRVIACLSGRTVFVRHLKIPAVSGERLDRIVRFEAKQQIPFPLEQAIIDYHVFESGATELDVTLVAVKKETINEFVSMLQAAKLRPDIIDVSSLCLFNSQAGWEESPEEVIALVDIGAAKTDIVVFHGGVLRFMRSAPVGGHALTQNISNEFKLNYSEAENLKILKGSVRPQPLEKANEEEHEQSIKLSQSIGRGLENIVSEIRRSIDFFLSQPEGMPVARILISGGTARMPGVDEFIEERLGIPVVHAHPFDNPALDTTRVTTEQLNELCPVAVGLALRGEEEGIIRLNFTPDFIRQRQEFERRQLSIVAQVGLLALSILVVFFHLTSELNKRADANQELEDINTGQGGKLGEKMKVLRQQQNEMGRRFEVLAKLAQQRGRLSKVALEVGKLTPEQVWLKEFRATERNLVLTGSSLDDEGIRRLQEQLNLDPYFEDVKNTLTTRVGENYDFEFRVNKLATPKLEDLRLLRCCEDKGLSLMWARVTTEQAAPKGVATLQVYGKENPELNNDTLRKVVDAVVCSETNPDLVRVFFMSDFGARYYGIECNYADAVELQKERMTLDQFLERTKRAEVAAKPAPGGPGGPGGPPGAPGAPGQPGRAAPGGKPGVPPPAGKK